MIHSGNEEDDSQSNDWNKGEKLDDNDDFEVEMLKNKPSSF